MTDRILREGSFVNRLLSRLPATWLKHLTSQRLWISVAVVGAAAALVIAGQAAWTQYRDHQQRYDRANAAYTTCVTIQIPFINRLRQYVIGTNVEAKAALENAQAVLMITPPGTILYKTRQENVARYQAAYDEVSKLPTFPPLTRAACQQQRDSILHGG